MNFATRFMLVVLMISAFGCSTMGQLEMSTGQVSVFTGNKIKADRGKRQALLEDRGVEQLHDYVLHYVRKNRIRNSLKLDITITTLRIGIGRDHMSTETVLRENGRELDRFTSVSTTNRGNRIKRFTKDLAKKIVARAKKM